jgi:hypothetical protein
MFPTSGTSLHVPWQSLGATPPTVLAAARVQLHHAAQVADAAAISLLRAEPDDSHTSFEWDATLGALVSREIPAPRPFRVALHVAALELVALDGDDAPLSSFPLDGRALPDALAWLQTFVTRERGDAPVTMHRHFEIPGAPPDAAHPWSLGDGAAFRELAAWYANADAVLRTLGGPVRCWPHHFDLATLLEMPRAEDDVRRTIGVGLSPGDDSYAEPYWYVSPYPYPRADALPALGAGHWHREGWVGAVLTGTETVAAGDADAQARLVHDFVIEALSATRAG